MKEKMFSLRFTTLILAVFFLLHALRNSLAHAHQAKLPDNFENASVKEKDVFVSKELVEGANNYVGKAKKINVIGGRKMIKGHEVRVDMDHKAMKNHHVAHMLSGNEERNALKSSHLGSHDGSYNQMEDTAFHGFGSSSSLSTQLNKPVDKDHESKASNDESQRLFEAAKEMMKLMRKDYSGRGRPKRKPPVNNRGPKD